MKKVMFKSSKLLIVVLAISALIFTGCSCGSKDKKDEKSTKKGVAATVIGEDGSVEYVEDIINDSKDDNGDVKDSSDDEENVNDLVNSGDGSKSGSNKSDSKKSSSKKSSSKSNGKKSNAKSSNGNSSNGSNSNSSDSKKSDSKKSDSKKDGSKSDDKEKTTKKSNFDIEKNDDDSRFGPIIDGKKKK